MSTTTVTVADLVEIGGSEWIRGDMHRVYFNDLARWYGLEYSTYGTGNIASAKLDGEPISNSRARRILSDCQATRIWYDVKDGKFRGRGGDDDVFEVVVEAIKAAVTQ